MKRQWIPLSDNDLNHIALALEERAAAFSRLAETADPAYRKAYRKNARITLKLADRIKPILLNRDGRWVKYARRPVKYARQP